MTEKHRSENNTPSKANIPSCYQQGQRSIFPVDAPTQSSPLAIPPEQVHAIYEAVADEIESHEAVLTPDLPIDQPYGLSQSLNTHVKRWKTGLKSLRAVPVLNAYALAFEAPVYTKTARTLVGLDALINVLDDTIDTANLDVDEKIMLTSNAAFASTELLRNIPPDVVSEVAERLQSYFTMVFQIPAVEQRLLTEFQKESDPVEQVEIATRIYQYRGRDIEMFAELPALVQPKLTGQSLDVDTVERVQRDLHTYRARSLLFKDVRDIERDAVDEDPTPVLAYLQSTQSPSETANFITKVATEFEYSELSAETYREALLELEFQSTNLEQSLTDKARAILDRRKQDGQSR